MDDTLTPGAARTGPLWIEKVTPSKLKRMYHAGGVVAANEAVMLSTTALDCTPKLVVTARRACVSHRWHAQYEETRQTEMCVMPRTRYTSRGRDLGGPTAHGARVHRRR